MDHAELSQAKKTRSAVVVGTKEEAFGASAETAKNEVVRGAQADELDDIEVGCQVHPGTPSGRGHMVTAFGSIHSAEVEEDKGGYVVAVV